MLRKIKLIFIIYTIVLTLGLIFYKSPLELRDKSINFAADHAPEEIINISKKVLNRLSKIKLTKENYRVDGIIYQDNDFKRLSTEVESNIGSDVGGRILRYSRYLSGGRVTFRTNSSSVTFNLKVNTPRSTIGIMMSQGVDLYIDGNYVASKFPEKGELQLQHDIIKDKEFHDIILFLPIWGGIENIEIFTDPESTTYPREKSAESIAYYGSSITQGCCASNPGLTFPSSIFRMNGIDFHNFGFAGSGIGHYEIIDQIIGIEPAIIVLDYWANPDPNTYKISLPYIISEITDRLPDTKIIVTGTFYNPGREEIQKEKDQIAKSTVDRFQARGFDQVIYVDGLFTKNDAYGLYDGRHLNSAGFEIVAKRLLPTINNLAKK